MQSLVSLLAGEVSHCPVHINTCRSVTATIHVHAHCQYCIKFIPANFFWDISVRFLSWECWDVWRRHDHVWRFPKKSEVFRRRSFHLLFTSKIRDFTHGFRSLHGSELTYFWKLCQARWQQLTFFNQAWEIGPQVWAGVRSKFSTRRRETHA